MISVQAAASGKKLSAVQVRSRRSVNIAQAEGWCDTGITLDSLYKMRSKMIKQGHIDKLRLEGLKEDRAAVLPGGLAVLIAVFETLGIEQMRVSEQALREGLLYDLVGRIQQKDTREATVQSVLNRWNLNTSQYPVT